MSARAAWRGCVLAGLLVIACSIGFGHIPGLHSCGDARGLGPIIGFELAATPAQVARLFGAEPCRSALIAAQRTGLWLDALGFIPSYTAFLCFAAWASGRWRRFLVAAMLVAGLCDEIEGLILAAILRRLPGTPALLDALWWETHVKFVLLAGSTAWLGLAGDWSLGRSWLSRVTGIAIGVAGLLALQSLFTTPSAMMQELTLAWATLLLVALLGAVWPRLLGPQVPAPPSA